ncbi:hypothetical protein CF651_27085 [Paenibacillus rigui]|uniref:Uncharacterized protein n=1 Tax=Paenibacillus rigui TaxID=554312 RepID=A0A229UJX7_9BACL|nr:hypothetical protein CF651_27085 [Paenibacillus rigui]
MKLQDGTFCDDNRFRCVWTRFTLLLMYDLEQGDAGESTCFFEGMGVFRPIEYIDKDTLIMVFGKASFS